MFNFPVVRRNNSDGLVRIDNLFDDFFKAPIKWGLTGFETLPAVDIYEKGNSVVVKAEIPGVKSEELDIAVDDGLLTISGEKKQENEVKEKDYYRLESAYGRFERTIRLPSEVKAENAKATYKDGVLKVELPKSEESKKKKINIDVK
ncbi:MAG: Hsp20/alpha crystallin family protein [Candidatus Omnitrophica bacterium]|nr:Hsp20/alpha crystallin family protein [Candidatus Omnitrophota bacterium]